MKYSRLVCLVASILAVVHGQEALGPDETCPLECLNDSVCLKHTINSEGHAFDPATGEVYFHTQTNRNGYVCGCNNGYTGIRCARRIKVCNPEAPLAQQKECQNGGVCIEGQDQYGNDQFVCDCMPAVDVALETRYVGPTCELPVATSDYCEGTSLTVFCVQGGTCKLATADDFAREPCTCVEGTRGKHCEFGTSLTCDLDCGLNGTCRHGQKALEHMTPDMIVHRDPLRAENFMYCECDENFAGTKCAFEFTTCNGFEHYCFHGSTCQMIGNESTCVCDIAGQPAAGESCEFIATQQCDSLEQFIGVIDDSLVPLPEGEEFCVNGGQCLLDVVDDTQSVYCECGIDVISGQSFSGQHCEVIPDSPSPAPTPVAETWKPTVTWFPTITPQPTVTAEPTGGWESTPEPTPSANNVAETPAPTVTWYPTVTPWPTTTVQPTSDEPGRNGSPSSKALEAPGLSGAGKFGIFLLILGTTGLVGMLWYRRQRRMKYAKEASSVVSNLHTATVEEGEGGSWVSQSPTSEEYPPTVYRDDSMDAADPNEMNDVEII